MSNSIIPDTDSREVASLAVAWEIVKLTLVPRLNDSPEANMIATTDAVIKVCDALKNLELIDKNKP